MREKKGITILDEEMGLLQSVYEILDIIADSDGVIATSHLDLHESKVLVEEARR